jgi:hypothetical protein
MTPEKVARAIAEILPLLVGGHYDEIERRTRGARLSAAEMKGAVEGYGRKLRMPPTEAREPRSVVEVKNASPQRWSADVDLWTEEEGRSDLTLELTVIDGPGSSFSIELDDLHVL